VEKNKNILLTTCAVGDFYIEKVIKFQNTKFSKNFDLHILTDKPHLFKKGKADLYIESTFNYFDKFRYGIGKIQQFKTLGLIYDADVLEWIEGDMNYFETNSNNIQYLNTWGSVNTFDEVKDVESDGVSFFNFFRTILKEENIAESSIVLIHEDRMFFPSQDYTEFMNYFLSLLNPFTENSHTFWGHKGAVGNGEGAALGYALHKSQLTHKLIDYNSI